MENRIKQCQGCGLQKTFDPFSDGIDNGSVLHIDGGYGSFHDDIDNQCVISLILCHECTLSVFRSIPALSNRKGLHSVRIDNPQYPLCCEFSWSLDGETIIYGKKEHSQKGSI